MNAVTKRIGVWIGMVVVMLCGISSGVDVAAQVTGASVTWQQALGKIAAIDPQRGAVKLQMPATSTQATAGTPQPTAFLVDEKTVIFKGLDRLKLEELKVGDQVRIEYVPQEGKNMARSIAVQAPGASEKSSVPQSLQNPASQ